MGGPNLLSADYLPSKRRRRLRRFRPLAELWAVFFTLAAASVPGALTYFAVIEYPRLLAQLIMPPEWGVRGYMVFAAILGYLPLKYAFRGLRELYEATRDEFT